MTGHVSRLIAVVPELSLSRLFKELQPRRKKIESKDQSVV